MPALALDPSHEMGGTVIRLLAHYWVTLSLQVLPAYTDRVSFPPRFAAINRVRAATRAHPPPMQPQGLVALASLSIYLSCCSGHMSGHKLVLFRQDTGDSRDKISLVLGIGCLVLNGSATLYQSPYSGKRHALLESPALTHSREQHQQRFRAHSFMI